MTIKYNVAQPDNTIMSDLFSDYSVGENLIKMIPDASLLNAQPIRMGLTFFSALKPY